MERIYVVNYKETVIGLNDVMDVECGTCDVGYKTEGEACNQVKRLAEEKAKELETTNVTYSDNGDYCCVNDAGDSYEYSVYAVEVD